MRLRSSKIKIECIEKNSNIGNKRKVEGWINGSIIK